MPLIAPDSPLYLASSNPGKLREFSAAAFARGIRIEPLPGFKSFPTCIELASTLQAPAPAEMPKLPASSAVTEPTSLFVGVNPEGEVDYLFLMQSSGNSAIDEKATDVIRKVKFKPAPNRTWGVVTFRWGGTEL